MYHNQPDMQFIQQFAFQSAYGSQWLYNTKYITDYSDIYAYTRVLLAIIHFDLHIS